MEREKGQVTGWWLIVNNQLFEASARRSITDGGV